eukprot:GFUD01006063.1.p2 GENE.GFUD01006063.1~~GFUD01006063.1.p2  ORF type:complete len:148 (+),score=52.85 GFUD01006063.1:114-557(+)
MEQFTGKWKVERGSEFEENVKEFALADGSTPEMLEMLKEMDVFFTLMENNGKWDWKMEIPGIFSMEQSLEVGVPAMVKHPKTGEEMESTITLDPSGKMCSQVLKSIGKVTSEMEVMEGGNVCSVTRTLEKKDGTTISMKQRMVKVVE